MERNPKMIEVAELDAVKPISEAEMAMALAATVTNSNCIPPQDPPAPADQCAWYCFWYTSAS